MHIPQYMGGEVCILGLVLFPWKETGMYLSLITRGEDPETPKLIMFNIIARPNFQIKVDISVPGSLHAAFSVITGFMLALMIHVMPTGGRNAAVPACMSLNVTI